MSAPAPHRDSVWILAVAWGLVVVGTVVIVARYGSLPDVVVLYRPPWAEVPTRGPKSWITVGRIALMGVGQLGAATAMVFASRGAAPWERFWRWLGLVAGAKTALECVAFVMPPGTALERALTMAIIVVLAMFAVTAARWWRRGELRARPRLDGSPRAWLVASLVLWAVFAVAPRFLA